MRKIIFRGKKLVNGEWVEGLFVKDTTFYGKPDNHAYIVNHEHPSGCFGRDIYIEVDPATVGQYTGLEDRNGAKIFEGDIVEGSYFDEKDGYGIVQWNDAAFEISNNHAYVTFNDNCYASEFSVIGNIHDNPELLKEV